ncbi:MAG TPA: hypothetical protein VJ983_01510 [candidate division Zixibacteria bacterium]|nr:hypothetical protein [candidate division Zixibacteria bacterium]
MPVATKKSIGYLLLAGVVIFAAVFLGIHTANLLAWNGSNLSPEDFSNQTSLKIGDSAPYLSIVALDGSSTTLEELSRKNPVIVAFVMPGCGPCGELLKDWSTSGFAEGTNWKPVVVVEGSADEARKSVPPAVLSRYSVFTCDEDALVDAANITVSPTLVGFGANGKIRFVSSGYTKQAGAKFFSKYLR